MTAATPFTRPSLEEALVAWKQLLAERDFATDLLWVFEENLCLERQRAEQGGFHPLPDAVHAAAEEALDIAYDHFSARRRGAWCFTGSADSRQIGLRVDVRFVV